jgi:hypothetical protein
MNKILFTVFAAMVLTVFWYSYSTFYKNKSYDFLVEAPCDEASQTCFVRDCENTDECPPNNLSNYRVFSINAADFSKCTDDTCLAQCESGEIQCTEIACGESSDDTCSN